MKYLICVLLISLLACSAANDNHGQHQWIESQELTFRIDTLATGLQNPWSMAFLPDGSVLIAERPGRLRMFKDGHLLADPIQGLPPVWAHGQGGLLEVALHPDYANNGWIYLAHAMEGSSGGSTAISRGKLSGMRLTQVETIFHARPHTTAAHHFGSRIVFDNQGYLYTTLGDRGAMATAQDVGSHNGSVIRLHDNGDVPTDNPLVGVAGAMPEIWSYGHRNIQGMQIHPLSGLLWTHEHGPRGGDEINIIEPGKNYGWPRVTHGINYDGSTITPDTTMAGMKDPLYHWTPSIAPCGMTFVYSEKFPQWEGNMLVGALVEQHIHRVVIEANRVVHTERLLQGMARFRDVRQGPDGFIYVLTENPGLFFRLIPR